MEELYKDDRVRAIGVCNFRIPMLADLMAHHEIAPAVNQVETHIFHQQKAMKEYADRSGTVHELTDQSNPIEREFYEFYRTPRGKVTPVGATPETTTHPTLSSNVNFMNFYPFSDIETISPRPLLFIAGENAHSREFSEEAYRLAAEPKELFIIPGAGHVDLCDHTRLIPFDKLELFFKNNLK